ncbi:mechanosensitive ion channel family protein [Maribacter polysaccharolyticus]|uniref:mechanosensitive ion channel family protein n=1 Tax=Maribacter polysaccharolyticus TaxID=3020831 RepID=UPI00237F256C|nr:mechanosensitive ion channel domain-containing protein [Maribacter polysaccharolyticus]MDE3741843.1 mechanosensitive ion channel [Maribacter polysaccharolyticus]
MDKVLIMAQETDKLEEIIKEDIWGSIQDFLNWGFHMTIGDKSLHVTIGLLIMITIAFMATAFILKWIRKIITRKMVKEDELKFVSVFKFINYGAYLAVVLIILSMAGIDITILLTASAVLFVGLGLALQDLFQDIIGGILIILDKSLNVGDIIELEGKVGKVYEIKLRTTRAITRDDKVIIVPNHKFISDTIYNHTQNHKTTRERVQIGVAYGSDVALVTRILEEIAKNEKGILQNPKPFVLFEDFGDSALLFSIYYFTNDSFADTRVKSKVRYAIDAKFRQHNISIPFPQRDVHLIQPTKKI